MPAPGGDLLEAELLLPAKVDLQRPAVGEVRVLFENLVQDAGGVLGPAEGVETPAQREFLAGLGVDVGQGFLFSPALEPENFGEFVRQSGLRTALRLDA